MPALIWRWIMHALGSLGRFYTLRFLLGTAMGLIWLVILPLRRRVAWQNIRRYRPRDTAGQRLGFLLRVAQSMGLRLMEMVTHWHDPGALTFDYRHAHLFDEALVRGKGLIIVSAHLGPWEAYLAKTSLRLGGVWLPVKPPSSPGFRAFLRDQRRRAELGLLPMRGAFEPMVEALGRNEAVLLVLDQRPAIKGGPVVDFMGHRREMSAILPILAMRSGAAIVLVGGHGAGGDVIVEAKALSLEGLRDEGEAVQFIYTELEAMIAPIAHQWFWLHRLNKGEDKG